jgi:hypothetical protein
MLLLRCKKTSKKGWNLCSKTFILNFDKTASIYKEEEKLDGPGQVGGMRFMSSMTGAGGTLYKNVKEKKYCW